MGGAARKVAQRTTARLRLLASLYDRTYYAAKQVEQCLKTQGMRCLRR